MTEPISIAAQGSFFVHGSPVTSTHNSGSPLPVADLDLGAPGRITTGQMYVEYQIPSAAGDGSVPIVLVHGGGHTGACWRTTPDGREGWATSFLRRGHPVYVVDQVARGRSGFDASPINSALRTRDVSTIPNVFQFSLDTAWAVFRFGPATNEFYADTRFPIDALEHYLCQLVPDFNFGLRDPLTSVSALAALLDRIGPAIIVTHSQSGDYGFHLSLLRPQLVRGIVEIEGGSTIDESQLEAVHARIPFVTIYGDHLDGQQLYVATSTAARTLVERLGSAGGDASFVHLPEQGITGNGHMMMLERNSEEIADIVVDWIRDPARAIEPVVGT